MNEKGQFQSENMYNKIQSRIMARLIKMEVDNLSQSSKPQFQLIETEIAKSKKQMESGNHEYALALVKEFRLQLILCKILNLILPQNGNSNIPLIISGIAIYAFIVFLAGICAVTVFMYGIDSQSWIVHFVQKLGFDPLFKTVISFNIRPISFLYGVFGGAGAVVSIIKRLDSISKEKKTPWLYFSQGLFNPIVGSIVAVVICEMVSNGNTMGLAKSFPLIALSFFAGFSERILLKMEKRI